ncbi:MAG: WYL domain-containing protein [Lachnospiraceae bacterium]|nr:WYL domain-containing protein [Lachnospiraceae bacterium]
MKEKDIEKEKNIEKESYAPAANIQLYVLAVLKHYGSKEQPMSVPEIQDKVHELCENEGRRPPTKTTLLNCLKSLRQSFQNNRIYRTGNEILTLPDYYNGTIHCYEKGSEEQFREVDVWDVSENTWSRLYYAFYGQMTDGEVEMLKASVIANQYLSAPTTARLLDELNRIRSASEAERKKRDRRYYSECHSADKLGTDFVDEDEVLSEARIAAYIRLLLDAIDNHLMVRMEYGTYIRSERNTLALGPGSDGEAVFTPFAVFSANGYYYLIAHAQGRGNYYRNYRVDRILSLERTDIPGERMPEELKKYCRSGTFNAVEYRNEHPVMYGGEVQMVTLECRRKLLNNLVDAFGKRIIFSLTREQREDTCRVRVMASEYGIVQFCLQYCQDCRIISPAVLAEQVREKLGKALEAYETQRIAAEKI